MLERGASSRGSGFSDLTSRLDDPPARESWSRLAIWSVFAYLVAWWGGVGWGIIVCVCGGGGRGRGGGTKSQLVNNGPTNERQGHKPVLRELPT